MSSGTIEVLLEDLLSPRQSVTSAHWEIMADSAAYQSRTSQKA
jgi:hypothetical protein